MKTMKFAKKMKLVDIDDISHHSPVQSVSPLPSDEDFVAPRILSILDNSMNSILNRNDMNDGEKWILYNQTLQKYLNYMKNSRTRNSAVQSDQPKNTSELFNGHISNNMSEIMSGILPIRGSIDNISHANVKNFFEQARLSDINNVVQHPQQHSSPISNNSLDRFPMDLDESMTTPPPNRMQTKKVTSNKNLANRRGIKRNAGAAELSGRPSNKVAPRSLYRRRPPAKPKYHHYWEATTAK